MVFGKYKEFRGSVRPKNCVALSVFAKEVPMAVKQLLLGLFIKLYLIKCNEKLLKSA